MCVCICAVVLSGVKIEQSIFFLTQQEYNKNRARKKIANDSKTELIMQHQQLYVCIYIVFIELRNSRTCSTRIYLVTCIL